MLDRINLYLPRYLVQYNWTGQSQKNEPYYYADNYKQYMWMEDKYWLYYTTLDITGIDQDKSIFLVCEGIDYKFQIILDGQCLLEQEGMFTPVRIDITEKAVNGSILEVLILPVPKSTKGSETRIQTNQSCKPAVSYGWDWHPRLIPSGICGETYIEVKNKYHIETSEIRYQLTDKLDKASITLEVETSIAKKGMLKIKMFDPKGDQVYENIVDMVQKTFSLDFELKNPELWWPNGQGNPFLYTYIISLFEGGKQVDRASGKVGFRRVRLIMHPRAWEEPSTFPKSRSNPPITMEINNRAIFCKGTNWVNPEIFSGIITYDTYRRLIELAIEANINMFRVWGGGIVNKECFHDICDELGLLVWQEFPLACNNYEGTDRYLKVLDRESRSIIKRLRKHPSTVLWCGGNELFNAWSGMTDQSLALRLLNKNCYELDRDTPFIMTSPLMGMAHGNYVFRYEDGRDVFEVMAGCRNTAYTEFGIPGPSSYDVLKTIIPEDEIDNPVPGGNWEAHHAFKSWQHNTWLTPDIIEFYYGPSSSVIELIEKGQLLQSEGYKCIFEEARRQKPRCSMALNWCYNEPWPTAANNSIINWPAKPKPAYYDVSKACRPLLASARIRKYVWEAEETFEAELWILNDLPDFAKGGIVKAYLQIADIKYYMLTWEYGELDPNTNLQGPTVRMILPNLNTDRIKLILEVEGRPDLSSEYVLCYRYKKVEYQKGPRKLNE